MRILSQKLNKENHQSREQKVNSVVTTVPIQRKEPALEEESPLLLQRPERVQTLKELEELSKEECSQNKELPKPMLEGDQMERNPHNQPGSSEKKKKEQMIDLKNVLTTKSPSVKSLAFPTIEESVSRARVMGQGPLWGINCKKCPCTE